MFFKTYGQNYRPNSDTGSRVPSRYYPSRKPVSKLDPALYHSHSEYCTKPTYIPTGSVNTSMHIAMQQVNTEIPRLEDPILRSEPLTSAPPTLSSPSILSACELGSRATRQVGYTDKHLVCGGVSVLILRSACTKSEYRDLRERGCGHFH